MKNRITSLLALISEASQAARSVEVAVGAFKYTVLWSQKQASWVIYYGQSGNQPQLYQKTFKDFSSAFNTIGQTLAKEFPNQGAPTVAPATKPAVNPGV